MSVSEGDVAFIDDFLMSTMTRTADPLRAVFERREPRCRLCRDETVCGLVDKLLDWGPTRGRTSRGRPLPSDRST
jgi:hypothetical protein